MYASFVPAMPNISTIVPSDTTPSV